ncbi:MAG: ABC transporter substrate-binding protein [Gammaproteobacteria bacterium]|jgi:phospholipid transport system substrate-binding protein|nr:ABC transporter substrate-binding protein [Gammaproteobacteria bacterium]MDH3847289.1 ABC transporter substrate-binding protein [Gammaproteobacteria bacterium]MDH3864405.1 ABC transporter substrate-binding protein [Gammaproteobacteria bacterium]MDH3905129.1 ABC transporter substrate-binding protein [Gammaproteobacteria bacterium]MDH3982605.1 ABC transporter substrate-binding protein [Gammaproteobacteria bacterium]
MKRRIDWYRPAAFLAALLLTATAVADPGSPDAVIEGAVMELTEKLSGRKEELAEDRDALYALINDILLPRFDRKLAAQLVLAKHWRTASDEQRERFINAFYDSLLRKYADGLLEFDEEQIEVIHFRGDTSAKRSLVKTNVTLDDGTKVPVHYDLVNRGDHWLIFNVKVEGVSYVSNYRTELDSEIRSTSLAAVIERLESEASSGPDE